MGFHPLSRLNKTKLSDSPINTFDVDEGFPLMYYCVLTAGSLPRPQNTMISATGNSWPNRLVVQKSIGSSSIQPGCNTWIKIRLVHTEPDEFWYMFGQLKHVLTGEGWAHNRFGTSVCLWLPILHKHIRRCNLWTLLCVYIAFKFLIFCVHIKICYCVLIFILICYTICWFF